MAKRIQRWIRTPGFLATASPRGVIHASCRPDGTFIGAISMDSAQTSNEFLTANRGLIKSMVRRYRSLGTLAGLDVDELDALAHDALWKALQTHDPSTGAQLSTYAYLIMFSTVNELRRKKQVRDRHVAKHRTALRTRHYCRRTDRQDAGQAPIDARDTVAKAMAALPPRTRDILYRLVVDRESGVSIGKSLGITHARIHQIKVEALARCRARCGEDRP